MHGVSTYETAQTGLQEDHLTIKYVGRLILDRMIMFHENISGTLMIP